MNSFGNTHYSWFIPLIISCFGVCFRFTRHPPHLYLTLHQQLVLVMSPQHPLVWCPPPLRPKATTICRLPQRSTVPTTTAVYRPISVNGMFKTVPSQEESFQKTRRSIYKTNYIMRLSSRINIPTSTEEPCAKALNVLFLYILRALFPNGCNRFCRFFGV